MNYQQQLLKISAGFVGALFGGILIALPTLAQYRVDDPNFNRVEPFTEESEVIQPPLPSAQESPVAMVLPVDNQVTIRLMNDTNAPVTYQVIGDTEERTLYGSGEVSLQNLPTPITLTFVRSDGGLLEVQPQFTSNNGVLELRLDEATSLDGDTAALMIDEQGRIFMN